MKSAVLQAFIKACRIGKRAAFPASIVCLVLVLTLFAIWLRERGIENGLSKTKSTDLPKAIIASDNTDSENTLISESGIALPSSGKCLLGFSNLVPVWRDSLSLYETHDAVDFLGEMDERVFACADGSVETVTQDRLWGMVIRIRHADGNVSGYASLSKAHVQVGDRVQRGEIIGTCGQCIIEADAGIHLHFFYERNGEKMAPPFASGGEA